MHYTTVQHLDSYVFRVLDVYLTPSAMQMSFSKYSKPSISNHSTPNLPSCRKDAAHWMINRSATVRAASTTNTCNLQLHLRVGGCNSWSLRDLCPFRASYPYSRCRTRVSAQIQSPSLVPLLASLSLLAILANFFISSSFSFHLLFYLFSYVVR